MKVCPSCSERFPDDANFCPMDAATLVALAEAPVAAAPIRPDPPPAVVPVPEPAPDESLLDGRFRPEEPPQESVLGEIRVAHDVREGRTARLIYVAPALFPSPLVFERTQRELRQLEKSPTDGIGRVLGHGRLPDGRMWIASAPPDGGSLAALVQEVGTVPLAQACAIVARAGEALLEAQKGGVIHRDVHPGNIHVLTGDRVQIVNFGLAPPINDRVFGDPRYLSPEQVQGKPVDQRSNIYSLAAVLYHVACGQPPFEGDAAAQLVQHETAEPIPPSRRRPELGTRLDALMVKAMAKSPTRRHLTLRQFVRDVQELGAPTGASEAAAAPTPAPAAAAQRPQGHAAADLPIVGAAKTMMLGAEPLVLPPSVADAAPVPAPASPPEPVSLAAPLPSAAAAPLSEPPEAIIAIAPPEASADVVAAAIPDSGAQPDARVDPVAGSAAPKAPPEVQPEPSAPRAPEPPEAVAARPGQFRETMWFAKGEGARPPQGTNGEGVAPALADERPVEDRYREDGSLSQKDAARLSLRGGAKPAVRVPAHVPVRRVPGERMDTAGIAKEMSTSNRWLVIVAVVLAVAGIAIVLALR